MAQHTKERIWNVSYLKAVLFSRTKTGNLGRLSRNPRAAKVSWWLLPDSHFQTSLAKAGLSVSDCITLRSPERSGVSSPNLGPKR